MVKLAHLNIKIATKEEVFGSKKIKEAEKSKVETKIEKVDMKHFDEVLIDSNLFSSMRRKLTQKNRHIAFPIKLKEASPQKIE